MDCQFCKKQFSTKGNLLNHQRTAKYCLQIQEENKPQEFICMGCNKTLCTKYRLQQHQKICGKYTEKDRISKLELIIQESKTIITLKDKELENSAKHIQQLQKHIEGLEDKLMKIAMKSTKTTNNNISIQQQNFTAITDENLAQDARKLTLEHIVGGGETIASVFLDGSLKNNALCTDISRRILYLKDEEGNLIKDPNAITITKRAFSSLIGHAKEIKNKCRENIDTDDDDQIETLAKAMSVVGEIGQTISGKSTEVSTDFAKAVCHGSTN